MNDIEIGEVIDGKYRITRLIGQGGMGAVYEGVNQMIDRRVAIKVLLASTDASAGSRFEQEARAAGRIGNDHILEILDIGDLPSGSKFMVCELLDGQPLSDRIAERGQVSPEEIIPLIAQLLDGLGAAHAAGVLHRDLKPDNIFVLREKAGRADFIKIIDFGISKFSEGQDAGSMSMTKTGMLVGTPFYMSPEQARGRKDVDQRADLYAVGVILYEALAGKVPFFADSFNDLLFKVVLEAPPLIEEHCPQLDAEVAVIVRKAMAREPAERYQTAPEFRDALLGWMHQNGVRDVSLMPRLSMNRAAPGEAAQATTNKTYDRTIRAETPQFPSSAPTYPASITPATPGAFGATAEGEAFAQTKKNRVPLLVAGAGLLFVTLIGAVWALSEAGEASGEDAPEASAVEPVSVGAAAEPRPSVAATQADQATNRRPQETKPDDAVLEEAHQQTTDSPRPTGPQTQARPTERAPGLQPRPVAPPAAAGPAPRTRPSSDENYDFGY